MKKIIILVVTVVFMSVLLSSCYSNKKCPAYSKTKIENTDINS